MTEPANNINKAIPEYQGTGPASRTESVELPAIVDTGKRRDVKFIRSTLLMLLMFCAGLGWVYFEGRQGIEKTGTDSRVSTVNNAIAAMRVTALTGEARKKQRNDIIAPLEFRPTQCQIPADELVFNPFEVYLYRIEVKEQASKPKVVETVKVVVEKTPSVSGMKLNSVLLGEKPAAMISGRTFHIGQKIGGWTVQDIKTNRVILRWKNQTHVLKME
jgi:hypothetical protein